MNQKVGINVSATADTSQVESAINALGQKIAQANRVQFTPVSQKSIDDVKKLNAALNEVLKTQAGLRQRLKATGQDSKSFTDWDWSKMYPHAASRGAVMQGTFERVTGTQFGGQAPSQPGAPGSGGGGWKGAGANIAQSGLRAMGPAGGVAAGALGTGMASGFGAGLMGLVGGIAALGVGKLIGAVSEKMEQAEKNNLEYDKLKRMLGDVGVSFGVLKTVITGSAKQMGITYEEAGKLGTQFTKLANLSGSQTNSLGDELGVGVGLSRSFGLDPSQGVGVLGQMRGLGVTTNTQESRRFALLIGETIGKSDAFAKSGEVMDAVASFAESQTRNGMSAANVAGYAGMFSSMVGSKMPGMDVAGAAGLLSKINSNLAAGGGKGEASQFFTGIVGHRMGLNPFQTQVMRENGAFSTNDQSFGTDSNGRDSAYKKYMGHAGPSGNTTLLEATRKEIESQYPGNSDEAKANRAMAFANHATGGNINQAMAMLNLTPEEMGDLQGVSGDLTKMSASGIGNLAKARGKSPGSRQSLREEYLSRQGADAISGEDRTALKGAGTDEDLKRVLSSIALKYDQEQTAGSIARDQKNLLDNIKTGFADKLIPYTQDIRAGILYLAGGKGKSATDTLKEIAGAESDSRSSRIKGEYSQQQTALTDERSKLVNRLGALGIDRLRVENKGSPEKLAEKMKERADVLAEIVKNEQQQLALGREETDRLKKEKDRRGGDFKAIDEAETARLAMLDTERDSKTKPPMTTGGFARMDRSLGNAPSGPGESSSAGGGYDPLRNDKKGSVNSSMKFFMGKGWSREQAAGITANLWSESKLNPGVTGDGGEAYGAAQWHADRQADFKKWSGKDIRSSTLKEQMEFVHYEMTEGKEKAAGDRLKQATTARSAGAVVSKYYERPKNVNSEAEGRGSIAETMLRGLGDGTPAGSLGATTGAGASPGTQNGPLSGEMSVKLELSPSAARLLNAPTAPISTRVGTANPYGNLSGVQPQGSW